MSEATSPKDNHPLLELSGNKLSVLSLEQAENVLRVAGDKKMVELRACLEGLIWFMMVLSLFYMTVGVWPYLAVLNSCIILEDFCFSLFLYFFIYIMQ